MLNGRTLAIIAIGALPISVILDVAVLASELPLTVRLLLVVAWIFAAVGWGTAAREIGELFE